MGSGAQACKALREEGFRVILVNSNPATIMTDPAMADATYIEPITIEAVSKIIEKECPRAGIAHSMEEAREVQKGLGFPCIIRPSFTMGGTGGGIAYNKEEFEEICTRGLDLSPTNELLIDESLIGWKEYEMEVVRDKNDTEKKRAYLKRK